MIIYTRINAPKPVKTIRVPTIYKEIEVVSMAGEKDESTGLYEIIEVEKVVNTYDTNELTQSFRGQTGIEAIMKRVAITGDTSLFNTITTSSDVVFDATKLPKTLGEAKALGESVDSIYSGIPDELKKGQSVSDFLANITSSDIDAYIASLQALKDKKVGESNE